MPGPEFQPTMAKPGIPDEAPRRRDLPEISNPTVPVIREPGRLPVRTVPQEPKVPVPVRR